MGFVKLMLSAQLSDSKKLECFGRAEETAPLKLKYLGSNDGRELLLLFISHFRFAPFCQSLKRLESSGVLRLDERGHQMDAFLLDYGQILKPSSKICGSAFFYLYFKSSLTSPAP